VAGLALMRLRGGGWAILQTSVAAQLAWLISHALLDHPQPFFAPIAAAVCLSNIHAHLVHSCLSLLPSLDCGRWGTVMRKFLAVGLLAAAVTSSSFALAQQAQPASGSTPASASTNPAATWSAEDAAAFSEARIAALKAGLTLKPDQEKNWKPFETAMRDMAKQSADRASQRMAERKDTTKVADPVEQLRQVNRGLRRSLGSQAPALPTKADTHAALGLTPYDHSPWNRNSTGFRNNLEGWQQNPGPGMHNLVHVWVGGDMLPATSPNDPVFFLNHCNVDRIWEAWMKKPGSPGRVYLPDDTAPVSLKGHRLHDTLSSLLSGSTTPAQMLNVTALYVYDSLVV